MADIHIRGIDAELLRQLKIKAASEGITLKSLVVPALEALANSRNARDRATVKAVAPLLKSFMAGRPPGNDSNAFTKPPRKPCPVLSEEEELRNLDAVLERSARLYPPKRRAGCPECGSLSGHQKTCKGVAK
jgi:hypothetical protein